MLRCASRSSTTWAAATPAAVMPSSSAGSPRSCGPSADATRCPPSSSIGCGRCSIDPTPTLPSSPGRPPRRRQGPPGRDRTSHARAANRERDQGIPARQPALPVQDPRARAGLRARGMPHDALGLQRGRLLLAARRRRLPELPRQAVAERPRLTRGRTRHPAHPPSRGIGERSGFPDRSPVSISFRMPATLGCIAGTAPATVIWTAVWRGGRQGGCQGG